MKIAILDYGINNIYSIEGAIQQLGHKTQIITNNESKFDADKIILPGVGAFKAGISALKEKGLFTFLIDKANDNYHILGICLGFQMLLSKSNEFGECEGLDIISGEVKHIKNVEGYNNQKVPNNGWRNINVLNDNDPLFLDTKTLDYFYFIHSFYADILDKNIITSNCIYDGIEITSSIRKDNIFGTQFHPEKSGPLGLKLLEKFILLS